jgi:hypothetical protein
VQYGSDFDNRANSTPAPRETTHTCARPIFVLRLRALADGDAIHTVRAALKVLLRRFGLQCLHIEELQDGTAP